MSDIKVGDIVEVNNGGIPGNFSGHGRVVSVKQVGAEVWPRVRPLATGAEFPTVFDFPTSRVTLVASVVAEEPEEADETTTADETSKSYHFFEALLDAAEDAHPSTKAFYNELIDCGLLHAQKQRDYGKADDPFANVRSTQEWGIPAWVGAMVRLNDKVKRLQALARTGGLANESAIDSFRDIAVYSLIALVLYQQESGGADGEASA